MNKRLSPTELAVVLRRAMSSRLVVGVSIYNPLLDPDGVAGRVLVETVVAGLT